MSSTEDVVLSEKIVFICASIALDSTNKSNVQIGHSILDEFNIFKLN